MGVFDARSVARLGIESLAAFSGMASSADFVDDAAPAEAVVVCGAVITAVGTHLHGAPWQPVYQWQKVRVVVDVGGREIPGQGQSGRVGNQVPLDAASTVFGATTRFLAPFFAGVSLESTSARQRSMPPRLASSSMISR